MFGAHLSIAGGLHNALLEAEKLSCQTVQVFTKNQQQWKCKPLTDHAIQLWKRHASRLKFDKTVSHDSYLINLASPDETLWRKSIDLMVEEMIRCRLLGIPYLVMHPGSHLGAGEEFGLQRVAHALDIAHARLGACDLITCLEVTAGQGSALGYRLEHLARIIDLVRQPDRLGVCLDTAHLFAAGYDFRGRRYHVFCKQVDAIVGLRRVKVLHLNDSKKPLGSRVDRHEHIGLGMIGLDGFRPFVRERIFAHIPKILETPKGRHKRGMSWDQINLQTLRSLI